MNCLCEALGMALPGNGTILAVSKEREQLYRRAAAQIVELVKRDLKPRDIATLDAFDNALALDVAMGGSTNTVLHTLAVAREAASSTTSPASTASPAASPASASVAVVRLPHAGHPPRGWHPHHSR